MSEKKKTWRRGPPTPSAKRKSALEEENAKIARFVTETKNNFVLWIDPIVEIQTRTGFRTDEKSGYAIEFTDGFFQTNKEEEIKILINHPGFRSDFHPLPVSGDWWEREGFFKKQTKEYLSPTQRTKVRKKEGEKVIEGLSQDLAKTVGTITSSTEGE